MEISKFYKSVLDADTVPVVICDLNHTIIYMNPAACERYAGFGGSSLVGKSLMNCHNENSRNMIDRVLGWFSEDIKNNRVHTSYNEKENKDVYMVALRGGDGKLIGYYEKHEHRTRDTEPFYSL